MLNQLEESIMKALHKVKDPEIDSISIVDLGMVERVEINDRSVLIELLPTFLGCPALDIIRNNVVNEIRKNKEYDEINVQFIYHPPWTSERISAQGRVFLKEFGIAAPPERLSESGEWHVDCPYCNSTFTTIENIFGPTACRSILYCKSCKNPFEAMKPVSTMM